MAKLDPISTLKMRRDKATQIINEQKIAGRSEDAKVFLDKWRLDNLGTTKSGALPPVDAVPYHLRGIIFKRADASSTDTKTAALTQKQMDGLNKVFPGAEGKINDFRKKQFNMGPMKIKPGVQLPDLAQFPDEAGGYVTTGGFFVDPNGDAYINTPEGMVNDGEYNPDRHGMMVPLAKNKAKNGMKIATNPDFEIEKQILDARTNKKAQEDAGQDMLLDRIFNKKNNKKGRA